MSSMQSERLQNHSDFAGLVVLFDFLANVFYSAPQKDFIEGVLKNRNLLAEAPFATMAQGGVTLFEGALAEYEHNPEKTFSEIKQDWAFLFYMIGYSRTSPYESVYRTDDHTLFGPTTQEVKEAFLDAGFTLQSSANEPADHFGIECSFVARMAERMLDSSDLQEKSQALLALKGMLTDHLLVYAPLYLHNVEVQAKTSYYRACAVIAQEALKSLAQMWDLYPAKTLDPVPFSLVR